MSLNSINKELGKHALLKTENAYEPLTQVNINQLLYDPEMKDQPNALS